MGKQGRKDAYNLYLYVCFIIPLLFTYKTDIQTKNYKFQDGDYRTLNQTLEPVWLHRLPAHEVGPDL